MNQKPDWTGFVFDKEEARNWLARRARLNDDPGYRSGWGTGSSWELKNLKGSKDEQK